MSPRFTAALKHAVKVAGHIIVSLFLLGLGTYVLNNETLPPQFQSFLTSYGIPAAIVNVVWASLFKFAQSHPVQVFPIDSLPDEKLLNGEFDEEN